MQEKSSEFVERMERFTHRLLDDASVQELQGFVREIVATYGWNVDVYPRSVRRFFWRMLTGDSWGAFRRKLTEARKKGEKVDAISPDAVKYYC